MSRSYKRTPYCGDTKHNKREANHKVRARLKDLDYELPHSSYKKVFEQCDICDFYWVETWLNYWDNLVKNWEQFYSRYNKEFPNQEEEYRRWYKMYKMK